MNLVVYKYIFICKDLLEVKKYLRKFNQVDGWRVDFPHREVHRGNNYYLKFSTREYFEYDGTTRIDYKIVKPDIADKLLERKFYD